MGFHEIMPKYLRNADKDLGILCVVIIFDDFYNNIIQ